MATTAAKPSGRRGVGSKWCADMRKALAVVKRAGSNVYSVKVQTPSKSTVEIVLLKQRTKLTKQQQQQQQRADPAPSPPQQQLVPEEGAREARALNSRKRRSAARLQAYNLRKRREAAAAPSPARKRDRSGSPERSPAAPAPPPVEPDPSSADRKARRKSTELAALPAPLATHNSFALLDAPLATDNFFALLGAPPTAPDHSDPFDDYSTLV